MYIERGVAICKREVKKREKERKKKKRLKGLSLSLKFSRPVFISPLD